MVPLNRHQPWLLRPIIQLVIASTAQKWGVSMYIQRRWPCLHFCLLWCCTCCKKWRWRSIASASWYEMWCGSEFEYWGSFEYLQRRFSLARFSPWISPWVSDVNSTPKLRLTHGTVAIWESQSVQKKWKLFKNFACFLKHLLSPRADIEAGALVDH